LAAFKVEHEVAQLFDLIPEYQAIQLIERQKEMLEKEASKCGGIRSLPKMSFDINTFDYKPSRCMQHDLVEQV
jgi:hypothetical protein